MSVVAFSSEVKSFGVGASLDPSLYEIKDEDKDFLRAAISPDDEELRRRIFEIQEKAYEVYKYGCIRHFFFIALRMKRLPIYQEILERGKKGDAILLDIGCMMGADVRNLAYEGYPATRIVGSDLFETYLTLGHELFRDKDTCKIKFVAANALDLPATLAPLSSSPRITDLENASITKLDDLANSVTFIYLGSVFHLFEEEEQKGLAMILLRLWTRERGAIIFGSHQGLAVEGSLAEASGSPEWKAHGHTPASWKKMWREASEAFAGEGAGDSIDVTAALEDHSLSQGTGMQTLVWSVRWV
ncbi:hypothetical protein BOTBODRAFT_164867 [Botryobasidium botryosum FD-172 SS1]|uniref:Methyltransferase domain-containing protein n=1 Tax=Botryobasidium botryosum (strain FD-172 SS1) TaxID=930990 RepID=A0A067M1G5_BOTB1|nr:hypothetical protein BOTBODRAFT_164867 [Botryobasidium botryosum FD-172 SS1]